MTVFSTNETLPIVRTHVLDHHTDRLAIALNKAFSVKPLVVMNGTPPDHPSKLFDLVTLAETHLKAWGLENVPGSWGWFCGDFCYYRALETMGGYQHYLLVEQDVMITGEALSRFVAHLGGIGSVDAGAARLTCDRAEPTKFTSDLLLVNRSDRVSCIFPLTLASRKQIELMKALRLAGDAKAARLNDEAIFASCAFEHTDAPVDFTSAMPELFSTDTFETNPPHLFEGLNETDQTAFWHPVVTHEVVLQRIETGEKRYSWRRLRKVLQEAPPPIRESIRQKMAEVGY